MQNVNHISSRHIQYDVFLTNNRELNVCFHFQITIKGNWTVFSCFFFDKNHLPLKTHLSDSAFDHDSELYSQLPFFETDTFGVHHVVSVVRNFKRLLVIACTFGCRLWKKLLWYLHLHELQNQFTYAEILNFVYK